jgi:hypothetical protein
MIWLVIMTESDALDYTSMYMSAMLNSNLVKNFVNGLIDSHNKYRKGLQS